MKKIIAILLSILALTALVSCDKSETNVPEGMQLVYGSESDGYFFFAPEGWITSNIGNVKAAYISNINMTSVSFAEVNFEVEGDRSEYFFNSYFNDNLAELQKMPGFLPIAFGVDTKFGTGEYAATKAKQYIYSYTYRDFPFTFMQILVEHNDRFFIFTYAAQSSAAKEGDTPNYDKYLQDALLVIENFRFTASLAPSTETKEYPRDEDGYILISDKKLSHFELYVPDSFEPSFSSAIVGATHKDGSSINISKASPTGVDAGAYWTNRKEELSRLFGEITVLQESVDTELGNSDSLIFGNWDWAYEYTYVHEGKKHHVYQILALDGSNGYVFTYTALEENYLLHFDEILKVIEKVRF